jgi:hypothetical protein
MAIGPVEVLVLRFEGNRFNGHVVPEFRRLTEAGTVTLIDGVIVTKDTEGDVAFAEIGQLDANHDAAELGSVLQHLEALISEEDVLELAADLAPDSTMAILVVEHTWVKPLRDAIVESGGVLDSALRFPGDVVEEFLAELAAAGVE